MDSSDCVNKIEQDKVTLFSKCDVYEDSHTGVNSFDSLACQVNLWRDAKVPKEGNKHISIRPSSFYITADSDHLVHWKTDERRGHKEHPEKTKRTPQKKNSTVSSHPMIYESCWQRCVSSHASLPGNSMRQICSDSMPGETCWPSMSQISTDTRLFVCRLVYWEVNGVKTLLCVCKVAKFARGRQPTKKRRQVRSRVARARCLLPFLVAMRVFSFYGHFTIDLLVHFFDPDINTSAVWHIATRFCCSDKRCPE